MLELPSPFSHFFFRLRGWPFWSLEHCAWRLDDKPGPYHTDPIDLAVYIGVTFYTSSLLLSAIRTIGQIDPLSAFCLLYFPKLSHCSRSLQFI